MPEARKRRLRHKKQFVQIKSTSRKQAASWKKSTIRKKASVRKKSPISKKALSHNKIISRKKRTRSHQQKNNRKFRHTKRYGKSLYDQGYDRGYDDGYMKAASVVHGRHSEQAYEPGYQDGYNKGLYEGGDAIVDSLLPPYEVLDVPIHAIVEAGVQAYEGSRLSLKRPEQVYDAIMANLQQQTPFSLIRLGDGELLTMAQEKILPFHKVKQNGHFLPYAGVQVPDLAGRDALVSSIRNASMIGIPKSRLPNYQPLALQVFQTYDIPYRDMPLTDSQMNFLLHHAGLLQPLLRSYRVLVVGNKSPELARYLQDRGYHVSGAVHPVNGLGDVDGVMEAIKQYDFDIALISAGVAAVLLAERTAHQLGKVAIDFGHMSDALIKGEVQTL